MNIAIHQNTSHSLVSTKDGVFPIRRGGMWVVVGPGLQSLISQNTPRHQTVIPDNCLTIYEVHWLVCLPVHTNSLEPWPLPSRDRQCRGQTHGPSWTRASVMDCDRGGSNMAWRTVTSRISFLALGSSCHDGVVGHQWGGFYKKTLDDLRQIVLQD